MSLDVQTLEHVRATLIDLAIRFGPRLVVAILILIAGAFVSRAVARRVVKKAAVYGVKEAVKASNPLVEIGLDVAGVAWEATESADTRCWGLLPEKIQVFRIELPAGEHHLTLQAMGRQGQYCGGAEQTTIRIADGHNTYLLANFPTGRLAGRLVAR